MAMAIAMAIPVKTVLENIQINKVNFYLLVIGVDFDVQNIFQAKSSAFDLEAIEGERFNFNSND